MAARADRGGHRVSAPPPDALIRWPDSWGTRFVLAVDTEEEFDWRASPSPAARSVSAISALPDAHRRFRAAGVPVTYMVDHPIATDERAIEAVRTVLAQGGASVGTQLHPWVNPPFGREPLADVASFPGRLPRAVEAAKLDVLTGAIEGAFGQRPFVYRAGRYGIGPATCDLLAERGYRVDSSMRARYDYGPVGGPDFRAVGPDAFRVGPGGTIVELPLTTIFTGRWRAHGPRLYSAAGHIPHARGALARLGLVARVALTPEDMPIADAIEAVRVAAGEGVRVLNFAFHSPSLVPGHTPYVRTQDDLARFWRWWDAILAELARAGFLAASIDEVIAAAG
jgi:hypothetical protein